MEEIMNVAEEYAQKQRYYRGYEAMVKEVYRALGLDERTADDTEARRYLDAYWHNDRVWQGFLEEIHSPIGVQKRMHLTATTPVKLKSRYQILRGK
jgi:hypothetical protein